MATPGDLPARSLLEAAVSPPQIARDSWSRWSAERALDDVSWAELRLLGAVAGRSRELGFDAADRPRLDGIRRFIWSATQMKIAAVLPALRRLAEKDLPFCLLKGGALIAGGHLRAGQRFIRDIDVLVPRHRIAETVECLLAGGWKAGRYGSLEEIFSLGFPRLHALTFRSPADPDDEIDLHLHAAHANRFLVSDTGLWARTRPAKLSGIGVHIPAPEDLLCTGLIHSAMRDPERGFDWAIDATVLAGREDFDWGLFLEESHRRGAEALVRERLLELVALGAIQPSDDVARRLDALPTAPVSSAECARRALALGEPDALERTPLPAPAPWLRTDVPLPDDLPPPNDSPIPDDLPLPDDFPDAGSRLAVTIRGRIRGARMRLPIHFRIYCGATRIGDGRTLPLPGGGPGGQHVFRTTARIDPAIIAASGADALSLYFGRRSRASGALGPESQVRVSAGWVSAP